ncbi:MAG TPA: hypothetical protein VEK07_14815 [Polyangiaceae bacterium]|nr:hypothetical protein [Polyangiaceae bacterium]
MELNFSLGEVDFLACQLRHRMQGLERELVHTDKRELQHALAVDLDLLQQIVARLEVSDSPSV